MNEEYACRTNPDLIQIDWNSDRERVNNDHSMQRGKRTMCSCSVRRAVWSRRWQGVVRLWTHTIAEKVTWAYAESLKNRYQNLTNFNDAAGPEDTKIRHAYARVCALSNPLSGSEVSC